MTLWSSMLWILLSDGEGRSLACIAMQHERVLPISQARISSNLEMM
jgi:hypothetical protein